MKGITLKDSEKLVLEKLSGENFCAYIVGGGVRDRLMGKIPLDTDITTSATPEETKRVFADYKVIETGIKHGTVTVLIENEPFEITTFRTDGEYKDNRHPESVEYTKNIKDDLSRRDFTINAIAYNDHDGVVDLFGGIDDINNKIIRCVGEPKKRFCEDALRIMRAVRFAATLDFEIEQKTAKAMRECVHLLKNVSAERIFAELKKLLCGKAAGKILEQYSFVIEQIIPEMSASVGFLQHNPHHVFDVYTHTARVVDAIKNDRVLRLAALFHDVGKPACFTLDQNSVGHFKGHAKISAEIANDILLRLKADNLTRERVCLLIERHNDSISNDTAQLSRLLGKMGEEALFQLFDLRDADNSAKADKEKAHIEHTKLMRKTVKELADSKACVSIKQLEIDGNCLIALGVPKGEKVGKFLELLLDAVIENKVENKKEALCAFAKRLLGEQDGKM